MIQLMCLNALIWCKKSQIVDKNQGSNGRGVMIFSDLFQPKTHKTSLQTRALKKKSSRNPINPVASKRKTLL